MTVRKIGGRGDFRSRLAPDVSVLFVWLLDNFPKRIDLTIKVVLPRTQKRLDKIEKKHAWMVFLSAESQKDYYGRTYGFRPYEARGKLMVFHGVSTKELDHRWKKAGKDFKWS